MKRLSLLLILLLTAPARTGNACSFFVCARGGEVLAGNNEDYLDPATYMWFEPGGEGALGRVYFGFENGFPQGGMNERGLFFDGAALSPRELPTDERGAFAGNPAEEALRTCATVAEVIELWTKHSPPGYMDRAQLQFADATGDAVIFEGDRIHRKQGEFQITTNFRRAETPVGEPAPCPRYRTIERMLGSEQTPTVALVRRTLAAVHQEGQVSTLYSNVYDLKRRVIHLYHFHNFEDAVVIDLEEELKKGAHKLALAALFDETFAFAKFRERHDSKSKR